MWPNWGWFLSASAGCDWEIVENVGVLASICFWLRRKANWPTKVGRRFSSPWIMSHRCRGGWNARPMWCSRRTPGMFKQHLLKQKAHLGAQMDQNESSLFFWTSSPVDTIWWHVRTKNILRETRNMNWRHGVLLVGIGLHSKMVATFIVCCSLKGFYLTPYSFKWFSQ